MNSIIQKPWGTYQVLDQCKNYLTKKIIVKPNGKLSLQSHNHRSEHWIVVEGTAEVLINDKIKILKTNESIFIPKQSKHSLTNNQDNNLILIEVWYGDLLDEEDIIRFEDIYGRV
tara:strand:- start:115 stop:459 length:345 start_codon:yes stop_codon:yes gene_type:complete